MMKKRWALLGVNLLAWMLSLMLLAPLARYLERAAPGVQVQAHIVDRADIPLELAAGTLDLAIDIPELQRADLASATLTAAKNRDSPR